MEHGVSMDHPFWDVAAAATREWQRLGVTPQRVAFAVRSVALHHACPSILSRSSKIHPAIWAFRAHGRHKAS